MSKLGERLIRSAKEAVAIAEGRMEPARVIAAEDIDVAAIRKRQNLSQAKFAERFHLSAATVRDWEQKRRTPDRTAANYLKLVDKIPSEIVAVLDRRMATTANDRGHGTRRPAARKK
jgi:putative transcriptional regulator